MNPSNNGGTIGIGSRIIRNHLILPQIAQRLIIVLDIVLIEVLRQVEGRILFDDGFKLGGRRRKSLFRRDIDAVELADAVEAGIEVIDLGLGVGQVLLRPVDGRIIGAEFVLPRKSCLLLGFLHLLDTGAGFDDVGVLGTAGLEVIRERIDVILGRLDSGKLFLVLVELPRDRVLILVATGRHGVLADSDAVTTGSDRPGAAGPCAVAHLDARRFRDGVDGDVDIGRRRRRRRIRRIGRQGRRKAKCRRCGQSS